MNPLLLSKKYQEKTISEMYTKEFDTFIYTYLAEALKPLSFYLITLPISVIKCISTNIISTVISLSSEPKRKSPNETIKECKRPYFII